MSGRPIEATIEPDPEVMAIVAKLRAARGAARDDRVEQILAGSAGRETRSRARRELLEREARELPEVGALKAADRLEALERAIDEAIDTRQRQAFLLERLADRLPADMRIDPRGVRHEPDGSLRVSIPTPGSGELGLRVGARRGSDDVSVVFEVARAGFDRIRTASGTVAGCEAEREAVRMLAAHLRARGVAIALEDEATAPDTRADARSEGRR